MCYNLAMSDNAKILTGLLEHRALEIAFNELSEITNPELLAKRAQAIARRGDKVLPMLLSLLDTDDPQLRGGLGQVATNLERDRVVPALRAVARSHARSDQARLSALTILDRFLDEPIDDALLSNLQDPEDVALQSVRELIHAMETDQFAIIEYLDQLSEQPPEVTDMILGAVPRLPPNPHLVTLLRMFAQEENPTLAEAALDQLSRTRSIEAAQALTSLMKTLPPRQATLAERGLRKLRMRGVPEPDSSDITWQALLSPVDGVGAQMIWFINRSNKPDQGPSLGIVIQDPIGIITCWGSTETRNEQFLPAQSPNNIYIISPEDGLPPIMLLEVPFEVGRQVLREALTLNWATSTPTPLEYRLLNPWIWTVAPASTTEPLSPEPEPGDYTPDQAASVLDHPVFASWFLQSPEIDAAARQLGQHPDPAQKAANITALVNDLFGPDVIASYRRRLKKMVNWLALASQPETAALARAASDHLAASPPAESPFLRRLVATSLEMAVVSSPVVPY